MRLLGLVASSALLLAGCGVTIGESTNGAEGATEEIAVTPAGIAATTSGVELVDAGFGQRGEYVRGVAIVTTDNDQSVGEFVTVSMNFLDASGAIVGTAEQVESFAWAGQHLVLPIWLDLSATPGVEVDDIDASISLSGYGRNRDKVDPLEPVDAREIREGQLGDTTAVFEVENPTDSDIDNARIGIVCRDADGVIVGGDSAYPNRIAAGKSVLVESDILTTGKPTTCVAYPSHGI